MSSLPSFSIQTTGISEQHNAGQTMEIGIFAIFVKHIEIPGQIAATQ